MFTSNIESGYQSGPVKSMYRHQIGAGSNIIENSYENGPVKYMYRHQFGSGSNIIESSYEDGSSKKSFLPNGTTTQKSVPTKGEDFFSGVHKFFTQGVNDAFSGLFRAPGKGSHPVQNGANVVQTPTQSPTQSPGQVPTQMPAMKTSSSYKEHAMPMKPSRVFGDVVLNEGSFWAVSLKSGNGNSVKMWGDPHVVTKIDGKTERFNIGYGPGKVRLSDGTKISWNTGLFHILDKFEIDRPGRRGDTSVRTGDLRRERGLETGLTDEQLREFAAKLREHQGSPYSPLRRYN